MDDYDDDFYTHDHLMIAHARWFFSFGLGLMMKQYTTENLFPSPLPYKNYLLPQSIASFLMNKTPGAIKKMTGGMRAVKKGGWEFFGGRQGKNARGWATATETFIVSIIKGSSETSFSLSRLANEELHFIIITHTYTQTHTHVHVHKRHLPTRAPTALSFPPCPTYTADLSASSHSLSLSPRLSLLA
jgi:hypothetical protein